MATTVQKIRAGISDVSVTALQKQADEALDAWRNAPMSIPRPITPSSEESKAMDNKGGSEGGPVVLVRLHGTASQKREGLLNLSEQTPWPLRQIETPYRFKRLAFWLAALPYRGWALAKVLLSGDVDNETYAARSTVCGTCRFRQLRVTAKDKHSCHSYCGLCGCPHWLLSRLSFKNRKRGWYCPARRHPGEYPDHALRTKLVALGLATYDTLDRVGAGCSTCGGSKAARTGAKG